MYEVYSKNYRYFQISWVTYVRFLHFFLLCLHMPVIYIYWQYQPFWIVSLFLTDKKFSRVLVCSSIFYYSKKCATYLIGHYNPSVRIVNLISHTTYVVCVNFIHKWRDLQFKVDSERQIFFWETFHSNFIYFQSFCQKSAERKSPKKRFSYFVLMSGLGLEPWLFV